MKSKRPKDIFSAPAPKGDHPIEECVPACFDESEAIIVTPKKKRKRKMSERSYYDKWTDPRCNCNSNRLCNNDHSSGCPAIKPLPKKKGKKA